VASGFLTQAPTLALAEVTSPAARLTQVAVLVMSPVAPPGRLSQAPVLVLAELNVQGRLTQAPVLVLAQGVPCLTRWCQCWKIMRTDGTVFAFTDHDEEVPFGGIVYDPCNSLAASASELGAVIGAVGNVELTGVVSDEAITETDLLAGKFDGAEVEVWMVPWENGGSEIPFRLSAGVTGTLSQGVTSFTAEVLTPGAKLQQQALLQAYTPSCRFELGDARCTVDLDHLTVTGVVTSVAAPAAYNLASRRQFTDSSRPEAADYFELGTLTWLTGPNAGLSSEVKDFSSGSFTLWTPSIYDISIGDQYSATPGCDKLATTCKVKFANFVNFGGFPDVPGRDRLMKSPDTKVISSEEAG
jgi:uncharacterized phage protein (TIGR02218 family)